LVPRITILLILRDARRRRGRRCWGRRRRRCWGRRRRRCRRRCWVRRRVWGRIWSRVRRRVRSRVGRGIRGWVGGWVGRRVRCRCATPAAPATHWCPAACVLPSQCTVEVLAIAVHVEWGLALSKSGSFSSKLLIAVIVVIGIHVEKGHTVCSHLDLRFLFRTRLQKGDVIAILTRLHRRKKRHKQKD